jgi:O-antigen/teichoic acid export membrane protein
VRGQESASLIPAPSLRALVLKGSAWAFAAHAASQLVRLASSLILTRLLFPEAFGLMALVTMVIYALEMLSDIGLGPAIIRDPSGEQRNLLHTAWTMQAIRGAALWALACVAAWPLAALYGQPGLAPLITVGALTTLIGGFGSTALHVCRRRMQFGRLMALELCSQVVALVAIVVWAAVSPTVWALVGGALVGRLFQAVASHALAGERDRFGWDASCARSLIGFGKWIFLSSALFGLGVQIDRLLLGHYLDMGRLGIYSIAILLSEAVQAFVLRIHQGVLFPAYGRVLQGDAGRLRSVVERARRGIDALLVVPIGVLLVLSPRVVEMLYDERYHAAGWMLQLLCIRLFMSATLSNSENCLVALGRPQYSVVQNLARVLWLAAAIPLGWQAMGIEGAVWAVALSELPAVAVLWTGLARYRVFSLRSELRSLVFAGLGALLGALALRLLR